MELVEISSFETSTAIIEVCVRYFALLLIDCHGKLTFTLENWMEASKPDAMEISRRRRCKRFH